MNIYLEAISEAVVNMDEDNIIDLIEDALNNGSLPEEIYDKGLGDGMVKVTRLFENKEYFVSEVIVCADTLNLGVNYLKNRFPVKDSLAGPRIVIGVVEGDLHEIGKNIVKIMFEASGFRVIDMGINVKANEIIERALEERADVITLSTMMTTTMVKMQDVINILKAGKFSHVPKVIIGGGCVNQKYADEIGADGYSSNAVEAVKLVKRLMGGI